MTTKLPDNFDIVASSDQIPYDWSKLVLQNLKERNKLQIEPLIAIYQSNTKLWYEHSRLQSLLKDVKHQFATVQHESAELLTSLGTDSSAGAVEKLKALLARFHNIRGQVILPGSHPLSKL